MDQHAAVNGENRQKIHKNLLFKMSCVEWHGLDEAILAYQSALDKNPGALTAWNGLALVHQDVGDFEKAKECARKALEIDPDYALAHASISGCGKMKVDDEWIAKARKLDDSKDMSMGHRYRLQYAIGKYYDDIGSCDDAFGFFKKANDTKAAVSEKFNHEIFENEVLETAKYYSDFSRVSKFANSSKIPVFIIGMPRSGTSLVEQILASHYDIFGAGELLFWSDFPLVAQKKYLEENISRNNILDLPERYLDVLDGLLPEGKKFSRVVNKMPSNFLLVGFLLSLFPNAKFINMMRNPVDNGLSIYFQNFNKTHVYANSLEDIAHFCRCYHMLMQHWQRVVPSGVLLNVRYEAVVDDYACWSRRIIEHLGLNWDPACLEFHKTERKVGTASNWQARQPIYKTSKERWRNYEKYVGPLLPLLELYDPAKGLA